MTTPMVSTVAYQVENRSWLLSPHGTDPGTTPSVTLDVSAFVAATHYPNGFIPSGTVLGKVTANGRYGPYDDTATDGRQTAAGLLFATVKVPNPSDTTIDVGAAMLVHGFIDISKLPFGCDADAQTDLKLIHFVPTA